MDPIKALTWVLVRFGPDKLAPCQATPKLGSGGSVGQGLFQGRFGCNHPTLEAERVNSETLPNTG